MNKLILLCTALVSFIAINTANAGIFSVVKGTLDVAGSVLNLTSKTADTVSKVTTGDKGGNSNDSFTKAREPESYIKTCDLIENLRNDYSNNKITAEHYWENKPVTLTLKVVNSLRKNDGYFILGRTALRYSGTFTVAAACSERQAESVQSDQYFTVEGYLTDIDMSSNSATLKNPRIVGVVQI